MGPSIDPERPHSTLEIQAAARTRDLLALAFAHFGLGLRALEIRFDLRGRAAGQARYSARGPWIIRYNAILLRENPESFLAETIPHEVAHLVTFLRHGPRVRPHGPEWRAIMAQLGAKPERCHRYDLSRIPGRATRVFTYHCACGEHQLTSIRHHRILAGQTYLCRRCAAPLRPGSGARVGAPS